MHDSVERQFPGEVSIKVFKMCFTQLVLIYMFRAIWESRQSAVAQIASEDCQRQLEHPRIALGNLQIALGNLQIAWIPRLPRTYTLRGEDDK